MKFPSEDVHTLIQAMSASEKRYFSIRAKQFKSQGSKYYKLYQLIEKQIEYDEPAVLHRLRDPEWTKNFPLIKENLFNQIMQSLESFPATKKGKSKSLISEIRRAELLSIKGLPTLSLKRLRRAERIAREKENFNALLEIHVLTNHITVDYGIPSRSKISSDLNHIVTRIQEFGTMNALYYDFRKLVAAIGLPKTEDQLKQYAGIMAHPLLTEPPEQLAIRGQVMYHYMHLTHTGITGKFMESYESGLQVYRLLKSHTELLIQDADLIARAMLNLINTQSNLRKYDEMLATADDVVELVTKYQVKEQTRSRVLSGVILNTQLLYNERGEFDKAKREMDKLTQRTVRLRKYLEPAIVQLIHYNASMTYFGLGQPRLALKEINTILNEYNFRPDVIGTCHLIFLILHYELDHFNFIEDNLKSVKNFFKDHSHQLFAEAFVKHLSSIIQSENNQASDEQWHSFLADLENAENRTTISDVRQTIAIKNWVRSKVGLPFLTP